MIVSFRNKAFELTDGLRKMRWSGAVRYPGYQYGTPSVQAFLDDPSTFEEKVVRLQGTFALEYTENDKTYIAVDNRTDYTLFFYNGKAYTSLLDLLDENRFSPDQLDLMAILELFFYNSIYSQVSPVKGITRLTGKEYLIFRDGTFSTQKKPGYSDPLTLISRKPDIADEVEKVIHSMPEPLSLDVTGGVDTRLTIAFLMTFGKEFEIATTGCDDFIDVVLAKQIAQVLGKELHHYVQELEDVQADLPELLAISDGLSNPLLYHRRFRMNLHRLERGVEHAISSYGPTKDAFWSFLWPFIGRQELNVRQFYWIKLKPHILARVFENTIFQPVLDNFDAYIMERISHYHRRPAFLHADAIGHHFSEKSHSLMENNCQLDTTYLYIEHDILQAIKNLPASKQYNHRYFPAYIAPVSRDLAALKTDKGQDLLDSMPHYLLNELRHRMELFKKVARRIGYKVKGRPVKKTADHPALYDFVRETVRFRDAVALLKKHNLMSGNSIPDRMVGTVLSLAEIVKRLHD